MKTIVNKNYVWALLPFLLLVGLFEVVPVISVIMKSFVPEGAKAGFTFANYTSIFTKKLYQTAIINSLVISVISSVIGIFIAFIGGKAAYSVGGRLRQIYLSVLNMVSNFTGIPLTFSFIILFGHTGVLTAIGREYGIGFLENFPLYTIWGLLLIYIYFQIPLAIMLTIPAFDGIRKEWKQAVSLLGGSSFTFWIRVGIPVLMPSLLGTFSVLFANAISAYATAYALLANNISILPIRISEQFVGDVVQRPQFGSALAVVLMALMVLSIIMNDRILKRVNGGRIS